jgi:hypothetical protein
VGEIIRANFGRRRFGVVLMGAGLLVAAAAMVVAANMTAERERADRT